MSCLLRSQSTRWKRVSHGSIAMQKWQLLLDITLRLMIEPMNARSKVQSRQTRDSISFWTLKTPIIFWLLIYLNYLQTKSVPHAPWRRQRTQYSEYHTTIPCLTMLWFVLLPWDSSTIFSYRQGILSIQFVQYRHNPTFDANTIPFRFLTYGRFALMMFKNEKLCQVGWILCHA